VRKRSLFKSTTTPAAVGRQGGTTFEKTAAGKMVVHLCLYR